MNSGRIRILSGVVAASVLAWSAVGCSGPTSSSPPAEQVKQNMDDELKASEAAKKGTGRPGP